MAERTIKLASPAILAVLGLATLTLRELAGDDPEPKPEPKAKGKAEAKPPENTYGLPTGTPIRAELIRWFQQQAKAVLGTIPTLGTELPTHFPPLADYDDPMASAMTPLIGAYWDEAGKQTLGRLGLQETAKDSDEWKVTNPHLHAKIQQASLEFCQATNATTSGNLAAALDKLRSELSAGLVDHGETLAQLTKRVQGVFQGAETWRARQIAASEASRAVHAAQEEAAIQSGVVAGFEWLISGDACPLCLQVAAEVKRVPIGRAFALVGHDPHYATVKHPPLHPGCRCAMLEVLTPEYGGPEDPEWGQTLDQPKPPEDYRPPEGVPVPKPKPKALDEAKPAVPKVYPPPEHPPTYDRPPAPEPRPSVPSPPEPPPEVPKPKPKPKPKKEPRPRKPAFAFPADPEALTVVKQLGGSTGAELVRDADGKLWVRKRGKNAGHLREEFHADEAYRALGVPVPRSRLYEGAVPVKLSEYHEGTTLGELLRSDPAAAKAAMAGVAKHFAADALLANWDVAGADFDNILVARDGTAYRVDNGGALRYRCRGAQGGQIHRRRRRAALAPRRRHERQVGEAVRRPGRQGHPAAGQEARVAPVRRGAAQGAARGPEGHRRRPRGRPQGAGRSAREARGGGQARRLQGLHRDRQAEDGRAG